MFTLSAPTKLSGELNIYTHRSGFHSFYDQQNDFYALCVKCVAENHWEAQRILSMSSYNNACISSIMSLWRYKKLMMLKRNVCVFVQVCVGGGVGGYRETFSTGERRMKGEAFDPRYLKASRGVL